MAPELNSDIQERIYEFIVDYMRSQGRPPTNREIGRAMDIPSTGHVDYHLSVLEKKGYISRQAKTSRGIELTKRLQGIPVMGRIAAGEPLDIFTEPEENIDVGHDLEGDNSYALIVKGRSMIEDHICDGDYVVIKPQSNCKNGDTIVAVQLQQDGQGRATLKRFFWEKEHDRVRLQPANSEMNPIYIPKSEWDQVWRVQGTVAAIFRPHLRPSQILIRMGNTKEEIETTPFKRLIETIEELNKLIMLKDTNLLSTEPVSGKGEEKPKDSEAVPEGKLNPALTNHDEKIVKKAQQVVNLAIQQEAAYERIIIAAKSTREQLNQIFDQGRSQAKSWFQCSLIAAFIGFLVILSGVVVAIATANISVGLLTSVASIVPNTIAVLFFQQARGANKRLDDFYGKLIEVEEINRAVELTLTTNEEIQDRYKGLIIFRLLGLQTKEQEISISDLLTKSNTTD